jgi:hypothetical protein
MPEIYIPLGNNKMHIARGESLLYSYDISVIAVRRI